MDTMFPKKVMFLANATVGHTIKWVNEISRSGIDVVLVSKEDRSPEIEDTVKYVRLKHRGGLGYVRNAGQLRALVKKHKPDIINAHYASGYGLLARLASVKKYVPYLLSVWGSDVYRVPGRGRFWKWLVKGNLRYASAVGSTSHDMGHVVKRLCPTKKVLITPFGVDIDVYKKSKEDMKEDQFVVGTVKKLEFVYGMDVLIKAFSLAKSQRPHMNLELRIAGGGSQLAELKRLCNELGLKKDDVKFLGRLEQEQVPAALNDLDVYVAVSRSESFGVAVLEASACEVPVIVSNVGGLPEVVADGLTGYIVESENADALSRKLIKMMDSKQDARFCMGKAGRAFVKDNYEIGHTTSIMIQAYKECIRIYDCN
ncbi:glycosyltransferase [Alloalcanivorax balearicus]|nr:glycosyltransferase [Alloalcanivorax balearicus]